MDDYEQDMNSAFDGGNIAEDEHAFFTGGDGDKRSAEEAEYEVSNLVYSAKYFKGTPRELYEMLANSPPLKSPEETAVHKQLMENLRDMIDSGKFESFCISPEGQIESVNGKKINRVPGRPQIAQLSYAATNQELNNASKKYLRACIKFGGHRAKYERDISRLLSK